MEIFVGAAYPRSRRSNRGIAREGSDPREDITMARITRFAHRLIAAGCLVLPLATSHAQQAPPAETHAPSSLALRVERPADGSILDSRQPTLEVCISGGDEATRSTLRATLDGETISEGFTWTGDCAQWRPSEGWVGFEKPHAWSDPPYEMEGFTAEMRDGGHDFEANVTGPSGEVIAVRTSFRVETTKRAASLGAGFLKISLQDFEGSFASANLLEARFGTQRASTIARGAGVLRYTDESVSIGGVSTRLAASGGPGETETTLWRFMAGRREGYGYRTGDTSFLAPYHGTSVFFADLDAYEGPFRPDDQLALDRYQRTLRVGSAFEGGIAFAINRSITLDAGYEQMAVYPHYVFWEAAGSGLVHGIALGIADGVSRQVARKAPRAAPIVSFLLRNGISYVIHHQRRSEVNWPFGGDPGLVYDGFKLSCTFTY